MWPLEHLPCIITPSVRSSHVSGPMISLELHTVCSAASADVSLKSMRRLEAPSQYPGGSACFDVREPMLLPQKGCFCTAAHVHNACQWCMAQAEASTHVSGTEGNTCPAKEPKSLQGPQEAPPVHNGRR